MRPAFKKEHPDLSEINLVREIAKNYKTADPALIQKYEADYQKEREDFIKKLFLYESKLTAEQKQIIQDAKTAIADRKAKQVYKKVFCIQINLKSVLMPIYQITARS